MFHEIFQGLLNYTAPKIKFFIKDLFSKCDQFLSFLQIWSHLLKKSLLENFILCALLEINLLTYLPWATQSIKLRTSGPGSFFPCWLILPSLFAPVLIRLQKVLQNRMLHLLYYPREAIWVYSGNYAPSKFRKNLNFSQKNVA